MMPVYAEPYTAQEGDTFYTLAKKHQIDLDELMKANANIDPLNIYGGLKLELRKDPAGSGGGIGERGID